MNDVPASPALLLPNVPAMVAGVRQAAWLTPDGEIEDLGPQFADGLMAVSLDGKEIMTANDRAYNQDFDGLRLVNRGGDYIIKSITVNGTQ